MALQIISNSQKRGYIPVFFYSDAGLKVLINLSLSDPEVHSIPLTTKEEEVAMSVGAHLSVKNM